MYAYGPDSDDDHDIDMEMVTGPDDCDVDGPLWLQDAPEDDERPDGGFSAIDEMMEAVTA